MGLFGKKKKNTNGSDYVQALPIESLPVATLVSETTYPNVSIPSTAPFEPSECKNTEASSWENYEPMVSRNPMMMKNCPQCNQESRTRVTTKPSWKTWAAGGCLFFMFWPLCWIPLVSDSCKTTEHFCVTCGAKVARIDAFEDCCVEHRG